MQYRLVMSRNVGYFIEERSEVIFRLMVNSGSIPEGEQIKCSSELKRTVKFSGVLLGVVECC